MLAYFSGVAGLVDAGWFAREQLALGGLTTETPVAQCNVNYQDRR